MLSRAPSVPTMRRHHAADLPPSVGGDILKATNDKLGKFDKGGGRCSRLCSLLILAATVSMLARHCYDFGVAGSSATGTVARVEHGLSSSRHRTRKINPIARGKSPFSDPFISPPRDAGHTNSGKALPDPLPASVPVDTGSSVTGPDGGGEQHGEHAFARALAAANDRGDLCGDRYIYVQELPPRFNTDLLRDCGTLSPWADKCKHTANGGFGPQLSGSQGGVLQETGWYDSDEHMLDVIFHDRIKRYECLTNDSSLAAAIFVPFYAGLDVARHLWGHNASSLDALALDMVRLVTARPEWRAMGGRDHFFVAGRTTWDFRRLGNGSTGWGSSLLRLPAVRNMTALVLEASPWNLNDAAIPYPTSFHPATDEGIFFWQDRVRGLKRQWLFSFAGAARPEDARSIASHLVEQCVASAACSLMECRKGPSNRCNSPAGVMKLFQSSTFCLQPQGDTYTRRSVFEALLAGCIPVFFHPGTAFVQYTWHLPKNQAEYSVYISEEDVRRNVSVEERLRRIRPEDVERMRGAVVGLIPAMIYSDTSSKLESTVNDAFDVAVEAVTRKVTKIRKRIVEGLPEDEKLEMYSWKYPLLGEGQKVQDSHEWDPLFASN
ncbi:xyloglucan galactosyltransferase KATAMARI1 homolog [Lolium perenne]|uniref:xyloglucan galactosyltransferase KATAMARI1 homolog n=1 Tax=Lolium perenne TaxID=4522 RepID=UPI0021F6797B|nr:xyloglucan galactosyltransferase KATAMARI1 homolog [Lolium perenne]